MKEILPKLVSLKTEVDSLLEYVKYQESIPLLSKEEKEELDRMITYLTWATKHNYTYIRYYKNIFGNNHGSVQFFFISEKTGEQIFDEISSSPCYTQNMEPMRKYKIEDLLR